MSSADGPQRWAFVAITAVAALALLGFALRIATDYVDIGDNTCRYLLAGDWAGIRGCASKMRPRTVAVSLLALGAIALGAAATVMAIRSRGSSGPNRSR